MELRLLSSLEKVFCEPELNAPECLSGTAWKGEVFSFQAAGRPEASGAVDFAVAAAGPLTVTVSEVMYVPVELPCHQGDAAYLRRSTGIYPDYLEPRPGRTVRWIAGQWRSLWVEIAVPADCPAGEFPVEVELGDVRKVFTLKVADASPAAFTLRRLEWFHSDCLASVYRVETWSEEHWRIVRNFVRDARKHLVNSLYTPLWTPPLDTAVGHERPTTQLLRICRDGAGHYSFDFTLLERWCRMAREEGIEYLELSHFFSQWGAKATPKIVVEVDGEETRLFGWDVAATDPEYRRFLEALVPALREKLSALGWDGRIYCHVSDEPVEEQLESYTAARNILKPLAGDWIITDALSHYEFYEKGVVELPIPSIGVIGDFAGKVPELWGYYCCGPEEGTVNRFIAMSQTRVRMWGVTAYVYDFKGVLHWGYNFYYTQHSLGVVDPFRTNDGGRAFPAGDPFLVYPGCDGTAWSSLRHEALREAWQDWCVLKRHEEVHGRVATLARLQQGLAVPIDSLHYPGDPAWLLGLRERMIP